MPPDDQNTTQESPISDSSPTAPSDTPQPPSEAPEAPRDGFTPESPNNPLDIGNASTAEPQNGPENQNSPSGEAESEPVSKPVQASEPQTAQIPVNEPLASEPEVKPEPLKQEPKVSLARELLVKARNMIQFRKRKKLDRVMTLFLKKSKITNDEVREFLHVSDATAERYLNTLEKENKIKQSGKTGKAVSYSRI